MSETSKKFDFSFNHERTALLICVGIAFLIWNFIKLSKDYETTTEISIEYSLPPLMEFTEKPPSSVIATFHGAGIDLAKKFIFNRTPTIQLDLLDYPSLEISRGNLLLKIQDEMNVDVRDIDLDYIRVSIDSTTTKKVPVVLNLDINFRKDFFLKKPISISFDSVILAGPQQYLQSIDKVYTELYSCSDVYENVSKLVAIYREGLQYVEVVPSEIQVDVEVEQFTEKKLNIPVKVVNSTDSVQVLPSFVELKCAVGISNYDELSADDFVVEADIGSVIQLGGQKSVPVNLTSSPIWVRSPRVTTKVVEYLIVK